MRAIFSGDFFGSTMLGGAEPICEHGIGCKKCQKGKKRPIYDPFKFARRQGLLGPASMLGAPSRAGLAQIQLTPTVNVNPNVKVDAPINIELGGLPLSIGLFIGSGLTFLMRTALPEGWPQTAALVAGGGLAAGGILNLVTSKVHAAAGAPGPAASAPAGSAPTSIPHGGGATQEFQPSQANAFAAIIGDIIEPGDYATVKIMPWSSTYPVRLQVQNPSNQPVSFTVLLVGTENAGLGLSPAEATTTAQVSLAPSEVKNIDIDMPIVSGHILDSVEVTLAAYKQRVATEPQQMLNLRSFIVK